MSALTEFRAAKDAFFRSHHDSPLPPEERAQFAGLAYYDANPELVFELTPEGAESESPVDMETSSGDVAVYIRYARVSFEVEGQFARLTVFRGADDGGLFLPFSDATSGRETYGGGRYLDVHPLPDGRLLVDFNYAYNPYCAYSEAWSCPLPPEENRLRVPIRAGEKILPVGRQDTSQSH